jgi:tripartite-type tricarboxylate transporter receptor subunit TctC
LFAQTVAATENVVCPCFRSARESRGQVKRLANLWLGILASAVFSVSAADYPDHAITMIVPFPPGGVADTVARPVAEAMGRDLQQPVIVENKAGAGGGIGMGQVAKAKPDGYTVLLSLSSYTVLPEADKILGRAPLYQLDQLKPIARFTADPTVFVVRADAPWKTWAEFAAARRKCCWPPRASR